MWIVSLVFAVFIAGDFGAARRSCANHDCETNCCMLPCLAQELVRARNMLEVYRELAGRDTVTNEEYDRKADRVTARQAELYKDLVRRSPQCVQKFPTFEQLRAGGSEVRRLQLAGFRWEENEKTGQLQIDLSVATNPETCEMQGKKIDALREMLPCPDIAEITRAHEKVHQDRCEARRGKAPRGPKLSLRQQAEDEVAAYRMEIKLLAELLGEVVKWCEKSPCKGQDKEVQEAAKRSAATVAALKGQK